MSVHLNHCNRDEYICFCLLAQILKIFVEIKKMLGQKLTETRQPRDKIKV